MDKQQRQIVKSGTKQTLYVILSTVLSVVIACAILWLYFYTKDYEDYFSERRGLLTSASLQPDGGDEHTGRFWLTLENDVGLKVDCGMLVPRDTARRYPVIVLMGGKATGRYAVGYALGIRDAIIVAPDYPYDPRASYTVLEFLSDVPEIRRALLDMIPSVMLLTDYLWQRGDVDTAKILLLGYSFGAPFVPCIVVHDNRAAIAAMVYGAGELRSLIAHNVRRYEGAAMSEFVGVLSALLLHPVEPLRYIDRISPTPLLMINGSEDEMIPRDNVELLYNAAQEPKKIIWLESRHVHPDNPELTRRIIDTLRAELTERKILVN